MAETLTTGRREERVLQVVVIVIARVVELHRGTSYWTPPWGETPRGHDGGSDAVVPPPTHANPRSGQERRGDGDSQGPSVNLVNLGGHPNPASMSNWSYWPVLPRPLRLINERLRGNPGETGS